jgi:hypothetical protein
MKKILFFLACIGGVQLSAQSILINELDADQVGSDSLEFVELVGAPNASLDGYILVFFNGGDANNASYRTVDLAGQTIPASGFFVVGTQYVPNVNLNFVINNNVIQNGADAVVLYQAAAADFPDATAPTATGVVDALVYGTADTDDAELMALFAPGQTQANEGAANNTESLSRVPDGGAANTLSLFVAQAPTPGATNGGGTVGVEALALNTWKSSMIQEGKWWISAPSELGAIQVWSITGSLIKQFSNNSASSVTLDLTDCPAGVYLVTSNKMKTTLKVVR